MKEKELKNRVALITGAGSGIGRAIALLFAAEGARIIVGDISEADGEKSVGLIKKANGEAVFVKGDISKAVVAKKMVEAAVSQYGRLDILCNNAGIESVGTVVDVTEDKWDKVIDVNLKGTFLCSKYAIPEMIKGGGGVVINIASVLGLIGSKGEVAYCASKGAIVSMTRAMALDFAAQNVRVNCICPGSVLTPTFRRVIASSGNYERAFKRNLEKIPLKRVAEPEEIAYAALYLASDRSSYVTGSAVVIDGGWSIS